MEGRDRVSSLFETTLLSILFYKGVTKGNSHMLLHRVNTNKMFIYRPLYTSNVSNDSLTFNYRKWNLGS